MARLRCSKFRVRNTPRSNHWALTSTRGLCSGHRPLGRARLDEPAEDVDQKVGWLR
jgi:hypothetical protein